MHKAKLLIELINTDPLLNNNTYSMHSRMDLLRKNDNITKITLLLRNSDSVLEIVKSTIDEWLQEPKHDFRVFALLVALVDANREQTAIDLSRAFVKDTSSSRTAKIIATNILLKDSLYGSE